MPSEHSHGAVPPPDRTHPMSAEHTSLKSLCRIKGDEVALARLLLFFELQDQRPPVKRTGC